MTWERRLFDLFDDLEQQAEGLALEARDSEVAELGRAEYAEVDLQSRLHASVGAAIGFTLLGGAVVAGRLARLGRDWCLVVAEDGPVARDVVVVLSAVATVRGLAPGAVPEPARPITARLGLGSLLRGLAEQRESVVLVMSDGAQRRGVLGRVGADFVEILAEDGRPEVVRLEALVLVQRR